MKIDEWVHGCVNEGRLLSKFPEKWSTAQVVKARRVALEKLSGVRLDDIAESFDVLEAASSKNIEQAVGVITVPLGIAGPLRLRSHHYGGQTEQARKSTNYFVPLATTEGALVASINRGCRAIAKAGGATVFCEDVGMTRGPVFRVKNLCEGKKFEQWLSDNFSVLKKVCEKTSRHLTLLDIRSQLVGRSVYVRFRFDTQEAMGMNMVTIGTQAMVDFIEKKGQAKCVSLSGNYCVDKKPAWLNIVEGRGKRIWAEVILSNDVMRNVLKTTAEKLIEVFYRKNLVGSAVSGSMGFNGHFANVVAALYLATGQDLAHVVEGSVGVSTAERVEGGVLVSCYLPNILVGTVGGGMGLPTQKAALVILGLGEGKDGEAKRFAEIVGGVVLAGEISLLASLSEGSLARTHARFGRRKEKKA